MREIFSSFPVLYTDDLILRKPENSDMEDIAAMVSDPEVAKYDWYEPMSDTEKIKKIFLDDYEESYREKEEITWGIVEKKSDRFIGVVNLSDFDTYNKKCEIGYYLNRNFWNKNYMTQSVKEVVKFTFKKTDMNRIEAFITVGNDASVRMLEKCGFSYEGCVRERDFIKGDFVDSVIMAILRRDHKRFI